MFKVFGLIFAGILLAAAGLFVLSTGLPIIQFPYVNWANIGFVMIVGSAVSFGTAFVASRIS